MNARITNLKGEAGALQVENNSNFATEVQSITGLTPNTGATLLVESWSGSAWVEQTVTLFPGITIIGRMRNLDVDGAVWVTLF